MPNYHQRQGYTEVLSRFRCCNPETRSDLRSEMPWTGAVTLVSLPFRFQFDLLFRVILLDQGHFDLESGWFEGCNPGKDILAWKFWGFQPAICILSEDISSNSSPVWPLMMRFWPLHLACLASSWSFLTPNYHQWWYSSLSSWCFHPGISVHQKIFFSNHYQLGLWWWDFGPLFQWVCLHLDSFWLSIIASCDLNLSLRDIRLSLLGVFVWQVSSS